MADFPSTLKIGNESKRLDRDGRTVDEDGDGVARVRKTHADKADFTLTLNLMTAGDVTTLFTHYNADGMNTFNFVWPPDGLTYSEKYVARPRLVSFKKGRFTYEVKLMAAT